MITRLAGSAPWEQTYGYCRALVAGGWALTAGTTATGPDGVLHPGDPYGQTVAAFGIALDALGQVDVRPEQAVRTRMYVTDVAHQPEVGRAHARVFGAIRPVATMVVVSALADPLHLVEVEVEAYVGRADCNTLRMIGHVRNIVIDCIQPRSPATFYEELLGTQRVRDDDRSAWS